MYSRKSSCVPAKIIASSSFTNVCNKECLSHPRQTGTQHHFIAKYSREIKTLKQRVNKKRKDVGELRHDELLSLF